MLCLLTVEHRVEIRACRRQNNPVCREVGDASSEGDITKLKREIKQTNQNENYLLPHQGRTCSALQGQAPCTFIMAKRPRTDYFIPAVLNFRNGKTGGFLEKP